MKGCHGRSPHYSFFGWAKGFFNTFHSQIINQNSYFVLKISQMFSISRTPKQKKKSGVPLVSYEEAFLSVYGNFITNPSVNYKLMKIWRTF